MKKYINTFGLIAFTHEGTDYISNKGDTTELPDCDYVKNMVAKGNLKEEKTPKTQK
jgi:hypothetical protein